MSVSQRTLLHYIGAVIILTIYGSRVCPFMDGLSVAALLFYLAVGYGAAFIARELGYQTICRRRREDRLTCQLRLDVMLFLALALLFTVVQMGVFGFPIESAAKLSTGVLGLGFFITVDLWLFGQEKLAEEIAEDGQRWRLRENYLPMKVKYILFAFSALVVMLIMLSLLIIKDVVWLVEHRAEYTQFQLISGVIVEFAFMGTVFGAYGYVIIRGYAHHLQLFLDEQVRVLSYVGEGNLSERVTVMSHDEFGHIARKTNHSLAELETKDSEIANTRDATILGLASLAEARDNETGAHIQRTQHYVKTLALQLRTQPRYLRELDDATIELMYKSAPLHDAGKVGIPDHILLKPGKLTDEEFEIMKQHPSIGSQAIKVAEKALGTESSFLAMAREISEFHHEKWDGSGYPYGLKGGHIPLSARLMAVADVYDALISKRVYKPAFSHDKAKDIIVEGRGSHFDPLIVQAFLECEGDFKSIAATYKDPD
ncbi:Cyclic di-GMP phosphodiesterase [BD1-7 clade bacterium]|uniref:Cyclic di-GMP phosphodiesterase n=1 Tax=BD1-7 clade bacterium TaxID=2029982 RepID=A0A5S9QXW8_9GAMM|nr:Cyclic di-GMP phosphodiesterase [BD1-7 clade bacterium]